MTAEQEFYTKLTALAAMCSGFVLTPEVIELYDSHLSQLGYARVNQALQQIIVERNSRDPFPSIKEIRQIANPETDPESEALMIASRIVGAVAGIGPYQSDKARIALGEVAWHIVQMEGGWQSVCQNLTYENTPTLKAQWRNLAKVLIARKRRDEFTLLDGPKREEPRRLGANVVSRLEKMLGGRDHD